MKNSIISSNKIELSRSPWLEPGLLMSTRIETKFGSFGVKIISQDESTGIRISNLYSEKEGERITRTVALTRFYNPVNPILLPAHKEILAGGSIGATFIKHGFSLKKEVYFLGELHELSTQLNHLMNISDGTFATVMYQLIAEKDDQSVQYCTIIEVYSPEFLTLSNVNFIYSNYENNPVKKNVTESLVKPSSSRMIDENIDLLKSPVFKK